MAAIAPPRAGAPPFPKWPDGRRTIQFHPMVQCDSVRTPGVPCVAPQTPLVPFTPVRVKLPVWPSTRSKWAPPRSLSARRSFGAKGVPFGERRSTCLQRGGGESDHERPSQDLDLPPRAGADNRRLEVVADGLSLFHGAQLAIDTTMVSPGPHGRFCAPAMRNNRRCSHGPSPRSERAHLPRTCSGSRSGTLVVVACEVGGRWSDEALSFLNSLQTLRCGRARRL